MTTTIRKLKVERLVWGGPSNGLRNGFAECMAMLQSRTVLGEMSVSGGRIPRAMCS